jgi:hypothetical protein
MAKPMTKTAQPPLLASWDDLRMEFDGGRPTGLRHLDTKFFAPVDADRMLVDFNRLLEQYLEAEEKEQARC